MHGLRIRPDIIIHEPFDKTRHASPQDGYIAALERKLNASQGDAQGVFESPERRMDLTLGNARGHVDEQPPKREEGRIGSPGNEPPGWDAAALTAAARAHVRNPDSRAVCAPARVAARGTPARSRC